MTSRARRTNADKRLAIIPGGELIRTTLNAMQVTTDQKVGGSSPSERAQVNGPLPFRQGLLANRFANRSRDRPGKMQDLAATRWQRVLAM